MLPVFYSGMLLSLSLVVAIGPQNAHLLRMAMTRQHVLLTVVLCTMADAALIFVAVYGLSELGTLPRWIHQLLLATGVAFLTVYGWAAARRCVRGLQWMRHHQACAHDDDDDCTNSANAVRLSRRQAAAAALGFSVLNPHAWLDTAVLIGAAAVAQGQSAPLFGWGAATGSALWFTLFGALACWLGRRLATPSLWIWIDGLVAATMGLLAIALTGQLLRM
ncbi:hypothetical protein AAV94_03900 [Lampropedia cohaerens]|uniref:Lysine transporter LysE n=1 Tax=Lampropedia cohaerens TaxID=1610491 RepID=A0A0U1Q1P3_9BURK|nr:LysE family transporter [Lampropedia cohaerens]KKW68676.1 hypothetical protein AAV94_03900 [Lampropedia cohaerens]